MYNEEALKSNYKYNMLFNSISNSNNSDEDANFNTNIISDFNNIFIINNNISLYEYNVIIIYKIVHIFNIL